MARKKRRLSPKARAAAIRNLRKARAKLHRPRRRRHRVRAAPKRHRRRTHMARKRRSGRRSGKGITVNKVAIAAPTIAGIAAYAKQALLSFKTDGDILHAATGVVVKSSGISFDKAWAEKAAVPLVGGVIASKVIAKVAAKEPAPVKKFLNARVM